MGRPRLRRYEVLIDYTASFPYLVAARDFKEARRKALEVHRSDRQVRKYTRLDVEEIKEGDPRYW